MSSLSECERYWRRRALAQRRAPGGTNLDVMKEINIDGKPMGVQAFISDMSVQTCAQATLSRLNDVLPEIVDLYQSLHASPELSGQEQETAATIAAALRGAGLRVVTGVGGHGVVGILTNGDGPTVALRADMDALPIAEQTGLPYASHAEATDSDGRQVPVMHACGHDAHSAMLVGAVTLLAAAQATWKGTLVAIFQPAEESFAGAEAMLADGLFTRFPRPDVVLGQHVLPLPAGVIAHRPGVMLSAARTLDVHIHGAGGHGSAPHATVDPIVIAAHIVTRLQTIVSREINPTDTAVVTVGTLHAGTKSNIIPDDARLQVNMRSQSEEVHAHLMQAITRIVQAECMAGGCPEPPSIVELDGTPITVNDDNCVKRISEAHAAHFGAQHVWPMPHPSLASEDFTAYSHPGPHSYPAPAIPTVFWFLGCTDPAIWESAPAADPWERLRHMPANHSSRFSIDVDVTLRTGIEAFVTAALAMVDPERS